MANLKAINAQIDHLQEGTKRFFDEADRSKLSKIIDRLQAGVSSHTEIDEAKRVSVLNQLKDLLEGIKKGDKADDVKRGLGHIEARLITFQYIFDPAIADVMKRQRAYAAAERLKDEEDEAAYIDALEAEFGIQIHGDPSEKWIDLLRGALLALKPEDQDILDLVPSFTLKGKGFGAAHCSGHTFKIEINSTASTTPSTLGHELVHAKEGVIILAESRKGTNRMAKTLESLRKDEKIEIGEIEEVDINSIKERLTVLKSRHNLDDNVIKSIHDLLYIEEELLSQLEGYETSEQVIRHIRLIGAVIQRLQADLPDPKSPCDLKDIEGLFTKVSNITKEIGAAFFSPSTPKPADVIISKANKYIQKTSSSDDMTWDSVTFEEMLSHVEKRLKPKGVAQDEVTATKGTNTGWFTVVVNDEEKLSKSERSYRALLSYGIGESDISLSQFTDYLDGKNIDVELMKSIFAKVISGPKFEKIDQDSRNRMIGIINRLLDSGTVVWNNQLSSLTDRLMRKKIGESFIEYAVTQGSQCYTLNFMIDILFGVKDPNSLLFLNKNIKRLCETGWGDDWCVFSKAIRMGLMTGGEAEAVISVDDAKKIMEFPPLSRESIKNLRNYLKTVSDDRKGPIVKYLAQYIWELEDEKLRQFKQEPTIDRLEEMIVESAWQRKFELDRDGYVNSQGYNTLTFYENSLNKIYRTLSMIQGRPYFIKPSHRVVLRVMAEKLCRLIDKECNVDFNMPFVNGISYLMGVINDLLNGRVIDFEQNLAIEAPEIGKLLATSRSSVMDTILDYLTVDKLPNVEDVPSSFLEYQMAQYTNAISTILSNAEHLTSGVVKAILDIQLVLGEAIVGLHYRREQLTTIVQCYRFDPEYFVKKVLERDKDGNFLYPKTWAKVKLCQEYGLLPSFL